MWYVLKTKLLKHTKIPGKIIIITQLNPDRSNYMHRSLRCPQVKKVVWTTQFINNIYIFLRDTFIFELKPQKVLDELTYR